MEFEDQRGEPNKMKNYIIGGLCFCAKNRRLRRSLLLILPRNVIDALHAAEEADGCVIR